MKKKTKGFEVFFVGFGWRLVDSGALIQIPDPLPYHPPSGCPLVILLAEFMRSSHGIKIRDGDKIDRELFDPAWSRRLTRIICYDE